MTPLLAVQAEFVGDFQPVKTSTGSAELINLNQTSRVDFPSWTGHDKQMPVDVLTYFLLVLNL